jgi:putative ABC transport system substrate-binding protein
MRRREFIGLVGGAVAWPIAARAQQSNRVYRIALVSPATPISAFGGHPYFLSFFEELRRLGYDEGRNLAVVRFSGEGRAERYAELAQEVVRAKPDVIVTASSTMVLAFKAASSTIPIVAIAGDPVAYGIAASLDRPGGNSTGATSYGPEIHQKMLELWKEAVPTLSTVGLVAKSSFWGNSFGLAVREAAQHLGIRLIPVTLDSFEEADYRNAFEVVTQRHVDAVLLSDQSEHFPANGQLIVKLANANRLPTMYPFLEIVEIGGLIAYSPDRKEAYRYLAACVDKILRGANPSEIPIYQSTKLSLAINLKTAKGLGLVFPASLLSRADEVIE